MRKKHLMLVTLFLLAFSSETFANKTSVALAGPDSVTAGTEVTITVNVSHKGNSAFHHTDWVSVKADGAEIARWEFTASKRPESGNFSREVKTTIAKSVEITAQGHCSIHGSRGPVSLKIEAK